MDIMGKQKILPPKSWKDGKDHYKSALESTWYKNLAIIQDEVIFSTFRFFRDRGMKSVTLPVTTGAITSPMVLGSDSLPVKVELEGMETYLADSMQFYLEYMLRYLHEGVFYIMPCFRGELADKRHLCQFYHIESEIVGDLGDLIDLIEEYIIHLCKDLLANTRDILLSMANTTEHLEKVIDQKRFPRIKFSEALEELEGKHEHIKESPYGFKTITDKGEKELMRRFNGIVWLTHHDYLSVPFYQASDETGEYARNADLLFGIGEVVGAGERHTNGIDLRKALQHHQVSEQDYEWYINMKDMNPLKTSGFGMGMERFILFLLQHNDIRDIQIIPRFNGILTYP